MNAKLKAKWIEALLSGKYTQTKEVLRSEEGYCCLGVLCDIMEPDKWVETVDSEYDAEEDEYKDFTTFSHYDGDTEMPNPELIKKAGIGGDITLDNGTEIEIVRHLANRNDEGAKFADIAKIIEENL